MSKTSKARIVFWSRLISWLAIGCGIPVGTFAHTFGLFSEKTTVYDELGNVVMKTSISLNGWGIISALLIGSFLAEIVKEVADASTGYSFVKQCYVGVSKTMPLIIAFAILYFLQGVIDQVMFCLAVIILCKLISTPVNPLPKWKFDKLGKEDYSTAIETLTSFIKSRIRGEGSS